MWARLVERAEKGIRDVLSDCRVTLDPDGGAYTCTGIFFAPHQEVVADGEGSVAVASTDPTVDIHAADLPVTPKTRDVVAIELQQADGTYAAPVRYRVTDTQDNGHGSVKLQLVKGG